MLVVIKPMESPQNHIAQLCDYSSPDGDKCSRIKDNYGKCIFHLDREHRSDQVSIIELTKLIENRDGDWRGFIFPENFILENMTIDFSINAQWSKFNNFKVSKMIFKKNVVFGDSTFSGNVEFIDSKFQSDTFFQNSDFNGLISFDSSTIFFQNTSFYNSNFLNRTLFNCLFRGSTNFNNVTFFDSTIFKGTRHIDLSVEDILMVNVLSKGKVKTSSTVEDTILMKTKKVLFLCRNRILEGFDLLTRKKNKIMKQIRTKWQAIKAKYLNKAEQISRVFESEVQMQDVDFREPERTRFYMVDFSKAHLAGSNFRGVHLQDILWQKKRGRKVVYDEIFLLRSDRSFKKHYGPRVEDLYRNLRVAFENNKDFLTASDFYVGEMEMARLRKPFFERYLLSVNTLYKYLSNYGTSPVWAFIVFLLMVVIHSGLTRAIVQDDNVVVQAFIFNIPYGRIEVISLYIVNSIKVLTLQKEGSFINFGGWQNILDTLFRIIGPVQLALLILSLRSKVKRH
jgi:uncharacterized protein YjbI with pentapeptide repeats